MTNREGQRFNPETNNIGANLETIVGQLPEESLRGVKGVFKSIRDFVEQTT